MGLRRVALLGDIHANLAALDAVLADVAGLGVELGAITGDIVTRGREPEECVRRVRALGWPVVQGNTDRRVVRDVRAPGDPRGLVPGSRSWTRNVLSTASLAYLAGLPLSARMTIAGTRLLVAHGVGDDPVGEIGSETPKEVLAHVAARVQADVVATGHTHVPHRRRAAGTLFVNPGSVGETHPPDQRPRWALLLIDGGDTEVEMRVIEAPLTNVRTR